MKAKVRTMIAVALAACTLLHGCARPGGSAAATAAETAGGTQYAVTVAASFYPMYIMLLNVTAGMTDVRTVCMTQPTTGCLHDYAVTADDMKNLAGAQFLVVNGAGMESFMDKVIAQFPGLKIVEASRGIPLIKGSGDTGDNPHVWVGISNAIQQVKNIADQLAQADPDRAAAYRANADAYVKKLGAERDKMHAALDGLKNRSIVTFHEAFPYFAQEFGLNIAAVIEREPGSEPSAKELDETIDIIRSTGVRALFAEPQYPAKSAETIARETGLKVYTLDPAVSGPMEPDAYLNIMDANLKVLEEALK